MATEEGKRLPIGVVDKRILEALEAAKSDGVEDLTVAEIQAHTQLATATVYDTLRRLANIGKIQSCKGVNEDTGRPEVRIGLPK